MHVSLALRLGPANGCRYVFGCLVGLVCHMELLEATGVMEFNE